MELIRVFVLSIYVFVQASCYPGSSHHHIHHRIHVPHKVKTIYHTKIIKVPEHHHHYHEKEKIITVEVPKKEDHPLYPPLKDDSFDDFSDFDHHYGESKKHEVHRKPTPVHRKPAPVPTSLKKPKKKRVARIRRH